MTSIIGDGHDTECRGRHPCRSMLNRPSSEPSPPSAAANASMPTAQTPRNSAGIRPITAATALRRCSRTVLTRETPWGVSDNARYRRSPGSSRRPISPALKPLADTRGIGGMHAQLRSDGAEILRSARGNHDQHTQLRARDDVLDFHDRLRHDPKEHVGGPKHRIDLGPIYPGSGVAAFDSLHEPQYHPSTCVTAIFAPLHRTCLIEEEQHET